MASAVLGERTVRHRPALDGLRGVAVAAVVVYHFSPARLPAGFLGVDLFFVLSGFLITTLLCREHLATGRVDLRAFWSRRFRRLLPAALLVLTAVSVLAAVDGSLTTALRGDVLAALADGANWRQIATGQSYFSLFGAPNPIKHFWSLAIEEQFYLVWPVLAWGGLALLAHRRHGRRVALVALAAATVASAVWMSLHYEPGLDASRAYFGTDTRAFELLIGALLAVATVRRVDAPDAPGRGARDRLVAGLGLVVALACGAAMVLGDDRSGLYYRGGALLWCSGVAFVIWCSLRPAPLTTLLSWTPLRWLGLVSYGIYLVHWPVFVWVDETATGADGWRLFAIRVAATLAIAGLSYTLLELPIRRGARLAPRRLAPLVAPLSIGAVALALLLLPTSPLPLDEMATAAEGSPNTAIVMDTVAAPGPVTTPASAPGAPPATGGPTAPARASGVLRSAMGREATPAAHTTSAPAERWTPPPPAPAVPLAQAQHDADVSLVNTCNWNRQPPLAEYRNNGTGRLVAVIGDSMTAQMRDTLLQDRRYDWYVLARCGTAIYSFDHPDPRATPGLPEAFAQLLALHPQALVIALGGTDLTGHLPYEGSMQSLLQSTAGVPCRSWANVYPNPHVDHRIPGGEQAFEDFNVALEQALAPTDVRLLDWAGRAGAVPPNQYGYHPWLNPSDWVHLIPGQGFEQRAALLTSDLARCF